MTEAVSENWWPDEEYVPYLKAEQSLYAWTLSRVSGVQQAEAIKRALARFHYEPMSQRGSITHLGAWKIAMYDLFGDHCRRPEDFGLKDEYEAEFRRLFDGV